ncbi:MAG: hypothetical protein PVH95_08110, partial [Anaerolineae bacterium]
FHDLGRAVAHAEAEMNPWIKAQARQAGAAQVEVQMDREDREVTVTSGWGDKIYLGTDLTFTAAGRPSAAT